MYFNDGEDPWKVEENHIRVFNFNDESSGTKMTASIVLIVIMAFGLVQS